MRICAAMIVERLDEEFDFTVCGELSTQPTLSNLLLGDDRTAWFDNRLYLIEQSANIVAPAAAFDSTALIIGTASEEFLRCFAATVQFSADTSFIQVHNRVQEIFAEYNRWEADIHRILSVGSDVQTIIDISSSVFGNPLVLIDGNYKPIAFSTSIVGNEDFEPIFDAMNLPFLMIHDYDMPSMEVEGSTDIIPLLVNGMHAFATSLSQQKYQLLLIEHDKPLSPSDALLLKHLSSLIYLAIGFIPEYVPHSFSLSHSLRRYMNDSSISNELLETDLSRHGWLPEHRYLCLKFYAEILGRKDRSLRFISERVASTLGENSAFEYQDSVVAFVNLNFFQGDESDLYSILKVFLQDNFIKAGVSNCFYGFADLRNYYIQADMALTAGSKLLPLEDYFAFSEMIKPLMLEWCTAKLPAHMVCAPEVITLKEYDDAHGGELCQTLYVLLKNNLNYTQTARELFIHRSTLNYRLSRIRQLTGINYENIDAQWFLLLSFELLNHN